jgi:hypothetical protein
MKRKNLIRSKSQSCSFEGPIKLAFHKGCKIEILNGPDLKKKQEPRLTPVKSSTAPACGLL